MNFKISSLLNWLLTVGWVGFVYYLWKYSGINKPDELNELGDFIAGAFAPLAFFWLVRGFYQQGKGLEQNSEALKIQAKELQASTEALQLQVQEMKASVDQQKMMSEFQRLEIEERHNSVIPILELRCTIEININSPGYLNIVISNDSENNARNIKLNVEMLEENIKRDSMSQNVFFKLVMKGKKYSHMFSLTEDERKNYQNGRKISRKILLDYENIFGRKYSEESLIEITSVNGVEYLMTSHPISIKKIRENAALTANHQT